MAVADEFGRLLFFSGGSALREVSMALASVTPHTVHVVTPFDSGGSSAAIRQAFAMPAVGDMRNRLLAIAKRCQETEAAIDFCARRIPNSGSKRHFRTLLCQMGRPGHECWDGMTETARHVILRFFRAFLRRMPVSFNPLNASLGNLVIAGGYLECGRDFGMVLSQLGKVLQARGKVLPVARENLHLGAVLGDGSEILGQHLFKNLTAPVRELFLSVYSSGQSGRCSADCRPPVNPEARAAIMGADCIIYSMGSFYSSLLANLLPMGVGAAISSATCPKIFVPSSGHDAEAVGLTVARQARHIVDLLRQDAPSAGAEKLLNYVLIDPRNGQYEGGLARSVRDDLRGLGPELVEVKNLVCENDPGRHVSETFMRALRHIAGLRP